MGSVPSMSPATPLTRPLKRRWRLPGLWTLLVTAAAATLVALHPTPGEAVNASMSVLFTGLGALITRRQPGHAIARLMFLAGGAMVISELANIPLQTQPEKLTPFLAVSLFLAGSLWLAVFVPIFHILYIFPTGELLSSKWRWLYYIEATIGLLFAGLALLSERWGPPDDSWTIRNPIGFLAEGSPLTALLFNVFSAGLLAIIAGGAVAMVMRWRRSSVLVRNQIKLVLFAGAIFIVGYLVQYFFSDAQGGMAVVVGLVFVPSIIAIPVAMTVAIVRHGLFEIDRLISRTVGYLVVTVILGAVYVAGAVLIPARLTGQDTPPVFVAAATLAVALLFNPLRKRVIDSVDRRFYRSRYNAQRELDALSERLRNQPDPHLQSEVWTQTVQRLVQPSMLGVWIRPDEREPSAMDG